VKEMLHRESFKKAAENQSQSQQSQENENQRTTHEITVEERCAIPRKIYNDISVIASASKKTNCEIQIEVLKKFCRA
jgi:hypothetical protein